MNKNEIGAIFLIAGTAVGAGMLALPIATAKYGMIPTAILMFIVAMLMGYTGVITANLCKAYKEVNSIGDVALTVLGKPAQYISNFSLGLLFYAILSAYTAGGSSIAISYFEINVPDWQIQALFLIILVLPIIMGSYVVDISNRIAFIVKIGFFATLSIGFVKFINVSNYEIINDYNSFRMLSILATSFGYHIVAPSIVKFTGSQVQNYRKIFYGGSLVCFIIYIVWLLVSLGSLPYEGENGYAALEAGGGKLGDFITSLAKVSGNKNLNPLVQGFSLLAIITSFLGIGMAFMEYWNIGSKKNIIRYKAIRAILCFVPPYICALFFPSAFVRALSFAAIAVSLNSVLLPMLCHIKLAKRVTPADIIALSFGVAIIVVEIYNIAI